jgi:hypothetical protein
MPTIDPIWIWIAVGAVVVLIVAGLITRGARRARTESLREKYGSEYDHVVKSRRSRTKAEQELIAREEEVQTIQIRPLNASERSRYRDDWSRIETRFLERPTTAVVEADELIADIMRAQGYPMGDFEKHAAHLSVNHPSVVEHYRAGHNAIDANRDGKSTTEELRQAMLHYRSLIHELLGSEERTDIAREMPVEREIEDRPR